MKSLEACRALVPSLKALCAALFAFSTRVGQEGKSRVLYVEDEDNSAEDINERHLELQGYLVRLSEKALKSEVLQTTKLWNSAILEDLISEIIEFLSRFDNPVAKTERENLLKYHQQRALLNL